MIPEGPLRVHYGTLWAPNDISMTPLNPVWTTYRPPMAPFGPIWPHLIFIWLPKGHIGGKRFLLSGNATVRP